MRENTKEREYAPDNSLSSLVIFADLFTAREEWEKVLYFMDWYRDETADLEHMMDDERGAFFRAMEKAELLEAVFAVLHACCRDIKYLHRIPAHNRRQIVQALKKAQEQKADAVFDRFQQYCDETNLLAHMTDDVKRNLCDALTRAGGKWSASVRGARDQGWM